MWLKDQVLSDFGKRFWLSFSAFDLELSGFRGKEKVWLLLYYSALFINFLLVQPPCASFYFLKDTVWQHIAGVFKGTHASRVHFLSVLHPCPNRWCVYPVIVYNLVLVVPFNFFLFYFLWGLWFFINSLEVIWIVFIIFLILLTLLLLLFSFGSTWSWT
jgi:hypothetical protein